MMTQTIRNEAGHYTAMLAGHDVDIQRVRFGEWQGWWTLFVDGVDCGWNFRTKQSAVSAMPGYVDGFIRVSVDSDST